jgi:hypothetical protein
MLVNTALPEMIQLKSILRLRQRLIFYMIFVTMWSKSNFSSIKALGNAFNRAFASRAFRKRKPFDS